MINSSEIEMNLKGAKLLWLEEHRYGQPESRHREPYYVLHIKLLDGTVTARMYDPAIMKELDLYDKIVSSSFN